MNLIHALTDTAGLLGSVGLLGMALMVFAESGILAGFFLPGDSLLFMAGLLAVQQGGFAPLWLVCLTAVIAAILGDQMGYVLGRRFGPPIFARGSVRWMGPGALQRAEAFFERYGPRTIVIARFVPIVRTLAPVLAGTAGMRRSVFTRHNVIGAAAWGVGMVLLGAWLGGITLVRDHVDVIVVGIVALSLVPVASHLLAVRRARRATSPTTGPEAPALTGATIR